MELEGKKVIIFIANMYEDIEFWYPRLRMAEAGAKVVVVGPTADTFTGKHGIPAKADKAIQDVRDTDFDLLIIPGGYSPDHMRRSPQMVEFVKKMNSKGKFIAAVCHAPWMLASAGIVKGKRLTSFFSIKDDMINAGAKWVDEEVVIDGNIITSRQPDDLPAFCKAIIEHAGQLAEAAK